MNKEKDYIIENLAILLTSGIGIIPALASVEAELKSAKLKKLLDQMSTDITAGSTLWQALQHAKIFPAHLVSLIRIGEQSGRLAENLQTVVEQDQKERSFRSKVSSAVVYPVLVMSLTVTVGLGVAWFILPKLAVVFSGLHIKLPLITQILIGLGDFLQRYGAIAIPSALLFLGGVGLLIGRRLLFLLPGISTLLKQVEIARFGFVLGSLLTSGLPVVDAVDSLISVTTNASYQDFYVFLKERLGEGNSFQKSFSLYPKTNGLFPSPVQQIIISAEQSGHLADSLLKVGEIYEEKIENTTKNLAALLEPILLVIVWLGVVAVALAVILPIYSLVGGLNP